MNTTPIQFMAWDSVLKVMLKPKLLNGNTFSKNNQFMQRTTLRSINDEPIYNHMIVKDEYGGHFIIDMWDYYGMHDLRSRELEIVGNSFQNPELLEMCK